jgi:hypothetical protein
MSDFIGPPYWSCPKCGKSTFGVMIINRNSYMRRCRECRHKQDFWLPKLKKKILYLDQFVVSNLMKLDNPRVRGHELVAADPFWRELCNLLFQLRQLEMICCPDSGSHEEESRTSPFNAELKKTYEALSGGITFDSFDSISAMQICELGRAWCENREPKFDFDLRYILSDDPNKWTERFYIVCGDNPFVVPDRLRQARTALHANVAHLFRDVWAKEKRTFKYWYDLERRSYQGHLGKSVLLSRRARFSGLLAFRPGVEPSLDDVAKALPSSAENILSGLEHIMRFPRDGGERSAEERALLEKGFGDANRIAEAPFVKLQSLMFAAIAMSAANGQKQLPDEGTTTDVETVAHLLPYCDAMFVDDRCRSLFLNIPLDLRPTAMEKLYSLNIKGQFLGYLRSIRDGITAEHAAAVREVHGGEHLGDVPAAKLI